MSEEIDLHGAVDDDAEDATELSNEELFEQFMDHIEKRTKDSTIQFYRVNFTPFMEYIEDAGGHLTEHVGSRDIEEFLQHEVEETGLAPKTVRHRYSAISRFYNCLRDDLNLLNPDERLPIEQVSRKDVKGMSQKTMNETSDGEGFHYLSADEVDDLIENVPAPALRNRALVMLMANAGMRASEVIRVRVDGSHLDLQAKKARVKSPKLSDDDENDPKWVDYYWRSQAVSDAIDAYREFGRPNFPHADESAYLFVSKQSERISYSQVNRIVKQAAEEAGLQGTIDEDATGTERSTVSSHVLRHSYAMAALENGMKIDEIRDNLHHSDISVTMKYLKRHEEDRKRAVETSGPQFG